MSYTAGMPQDSVQVSLPDQTAIPELLERNGAILAIEKLHTRDDHEDKWAWSQNIHAKIFTQKG